jgi:hypothetical protein
MPFPPFAAAMAAGFVPAGYGHPCFFWIVTVFNIVYNIEIKFTAQVEAVVEGRRVKSGT